VRSKVILYFFVTLTTDL